MYIPMFWCGVAATVVVEVIGVVAWAIVDTHKKKKAKEENVAG